LSEEDSWPVEELAKDAKIVSDALVASSSFLERYKRGRESAEKAIEIYKSLVSYDFVVLPTPNIILGGVNSRINERMELYIGKWPNELFLPIAEESANVNVLISGFFKDMKVTFTEIRAGDVYLPCGKTAVLLDLEKFYNWMVRLEKNKLVDGKLTFEEIVLDSCSFIKMK